MKVDAWLLAVAPMAPLTRCGEPTVIVLPIPHRMPLLLGLNTPLGIRDQMWDPPKEGARVFLASESALGSAAVRALPLIADALEGELWRAGLLGVPSQYHRCPSTALSRRASVEAAEV